MEQRVDGTKTRMSMYSTPSPENGLSWEEFVATGRHNELVQLETVLGLYEKSRDRMKVAEDPIDELRTIITELTGSILYPRKDKKPFVRIPLMEGAREAHKELTAILTFFHNS